MNHAQLTVLGRALHRGRNRLVTQERTQGFRSVQGALLARAVSPGRHQVAPRLRSC